MKKSNVLTSVILVVFLSMFVFGCSKYDKMNLLGTYEIDIKAEKGLGADVDSAKEVLFFPSSPAGTYIQTYYARENSKPVEWEIKGKYERKNNKITFTNRVKNGDENNRQGDIPFEKYRIENDKLILIVKGEGFANDEKVYTQVPSKSKD